MTPLTGDSVARRAVRKACTVAILLLAGVAVQPQAVSLEYQLKAGYLFNFVKFVEWPAEDAGPLTICVAGRNPFGDVLADIVSDESVDGRRLSTRVIHTPEPGCHVVFVPEDVATTPYLRAARGSPTLTVGETPGFIARGGIVNFVLEEGKVRFEMNAEAADRAQLRISSHLLRLARNRGVRPS
jgi:hypothetical protein